jgi:hypothetical protein
MLKVRYFRIQISREISGFIEAITKRTSFSDNSSIEINRISKEDVAFDYALPRLIPIRRIAEDGSQSIETISTIDIYSLRFFRTDKNQYLSIVDPPRGARLITSLLDQILGGGQYFLEPMELTPDIISKHVKKFESARLVSAKVRDFEVYKGAVGRLEITSQSGLMPCIAPFLENKFHRIDALTYEVSQHFNQGLVYYYRNGTLKASGPLVELAFRNLESCFE